MHRLIQEGGDDSPSASILTHLKLTGTVARTGSSTISAAHEHPRSSKRKLKVVVAMVPAGGTCAHRKSACGGRQDGIKYRSRCAKSVMKPPLEVWFHVISITALWTAHRYN